jgi:hypothetical protein
MVRETQDCLCPANLALALLWKVMGVKSSWSLHRNKFLVLRDLLKQVNLDGKLSIVAFDDDPGTLD